MYQYLHFYIDLDWSRKVESSTYFKDLSSLVQFAYQHNASVYYSQAQLDEFLLNCNDLDENFIKSYGNILSVILENAIRLTEQHFVFEVYFAGANSNLKSVNNKILQAIKINDKQSVLSFSQESCNLLRIISNTEFEKIPVSYIKNIEDIKDWILMNCEKRLFNVSKKHGSTNKSAFASNKGKKVSQLKCSKDHAYLLLTTAIADFNIKNERLFNWDVLNNTFIEFFLEGNSNWHGFHLEISDWNRVPNTIRTYFNK